MTLTAPMRCSALAEGLGEPMIGTVDQRPRWLLIEDHGTWGHDAVGDLLGADRAAAFKRLGVRVLLIRRREGDPEADAARRTILIDVRAAAMAVRVTRALEDLDPAWVAEVPLDGFGTLLEGPIFLVCANGKRDACCALRGRVMLAALGPAEPGRTWECTHLGGHRFAANLVCLPDGILYGRVSAEDGVRLAAAYRAGELDPALLRGRSAWPPPAQVAEQHVRVSEALTGLRDVELISVDADDGHAEVTLSVRGAERSLQLLAERLEQPRPTSCRADELEQPLHWRIVGAA